MNQQPAPAPTRRHRTHLLPLLPPRLKQTNPHPKAPIRPSLRAQRPHAPLPRCLASCLLSVLLAGAAFAQTTSRQHITQPVDPADTILASALAALDHKDYDSAATQLQDYLVKKPDDASAHFQLGYAYTALQRPADARTEYEKAIQLKPDLTEAQLNLGLTLIETDPGAAVAPLTKATELLPDQARPQFLLGWALERSGKAADAIAHYREAEKLDGDDFDTHMALGRALLGLDQAADAETEFRAAINSQPDAARPRLGLAQSLYAQKKLEPAADAYSTYLAAAPSDDAARLEHASLLDDLGKYPDALAELDRAAASRPESVRALKLRSLIFFQQNKFDDAIPVLQKAQALAPQDPDIPARLGHVYLEKKDYTNAVRVLGAAFRANPAATDVLKDLVAAQYLNKNYPAALDGIDLLAKRDTLPAGSWFIRATCYDKLGQSAKALDAYEKFLQLNKDENNDMYFEASARVRFLKRELENKKR